MQGKIDFLKETVNLAADNIKKNNGGPFGAIVVKDGRIIGKGTNSVVSDNDPTSHAEINAIREACKNLNSFQLENCEIYSSCEPCPMCLGAIYWARPAKLIFASTRHDAADAGFDDAMLYQEISLQPSDRELPSEYLPLEKAKKLFEEWINNDQKIPY